MVEASRRTVTVVLSDLAGSTAMQEALDPESVRQIMARYYEVMRSAVARHEGRVEKFIGDAVVAVFGTPVVREDDALRAVRCAAAMVGDLEALNDELERHWGVRLASRTGVNTGELVISGEGILVGDTMNTAARLEQSAAAGDVLIGEATWRLVRHHVALEEVAALELKGKTAPVRAWRLLSGAGAPASGLEDAPLVGRAAELRRLHAALDVAVAEQACRLVTVVGSPGLGKSRLAAEFADAVRERAQVVTGHCEPSGEGNAFLPVAEMIREVAGIGELDPPQMAREKLRALAPEESDPERERLVERVAGVLGVSEPASAQETFWALRRGLEDLARRRPLVLVLDDLHWAQPMLLDLLEHLVDWIAGAPVLIVALTRPELRETREVLTSIGRRATDVIELEPLESGECRALVDGMLRAAQLPGELFDRMLETTGGNPLFLGEVVRMLVDEGAVIQSEHGWEVTGGGAAVEVPPTIHALLTARIERLGAEERAVVERAAVIGQQFYRGAVAELLAPPVRAGIDGHLAALRRKELVEPEGVYWIDEPVYRFHHVLLRDAAYRLLLKEARAVLHERFADWLADKAGELFGEYEEVIAFHLEQAHSYRRELGPLDATGRQLGARAAARLLSAGRRALAREDLAAAENLLSRALACEGGAETEILWDLAETVLSSGDAVRAAEIVARYRAAIRDDDVGRARAAVIEGQLANLTGEGDPAATAETVAAAAAELRRLGDGHGEAKAWTVVAQANASLGRVALVETALDRALTAARGVEDRRRTTAVLAAAPRAALWGPSTVVRASGRCLDVVRILRMTPGNRHVEAIALRCQAVLEAMRGRPDAAREILNGARATLEELGLSLELNETRVHAAMVELLAGEPGAAVEHLRTALAGLESLGADAAAANAAALLARALLARGEPGDADAALAELRFAQEHGGEDLRTAIITMCARAEALAATGKIDEGIASALRAVELAEPTDALSDKADAAMTLARVLLAAGRRDEAMASVRAAATSYESKGHTVGADSAARLAGKAAEPVVVAPPATTTGANALGNRPSEQVIAEFIRCYNERDLDALARLVTDDCYLLDHRRMAWEEVRGRERCISFIRSPLEASPHLRWDIDEVIARDDRVLASRNTWRGRGVKAGELELSVGAVMLTENGRWLGVEFYEPTDREGMLRRYRELGGARATALGDRPPERYYAWFAERFAEHDIDALVERCAPEYVSEDRRSAISQGTVRGREGYRQTMGSVLTMPDARIEVRDVLACDERVIALRYVLRGHAARLDGEVEIPIGEVGVVQQGLLQASEWFDYDDEAAMLARFYALGGELGVLGDEPPARASAEHNRRVISRDVDHILTAFDPDFVVRDHRPTVSQDVQGLADMRVAWETIMSVTDHLRIDYDEVLACDERVIAVRVGYRGRARDGGAAEVLQGCVAVFEDGLWTSMDVYEYDDDGRMLARFDELAGGRLARGRREPELLAAEEERRYNLHDLDGFLELFAPHYVLVDHRSIGWGRLSRDGLREGTEAAFRDAPDIRKEVEEVLACDEHVIAARIAYHGDGRTAGAWRLEAGTVSVLENGVWASSDLFEPTDRQAMIARYVELGGGLSALGESPVERFAAEFYTRQARGELEPLQELIDERYVHVDHRVLGWDDARGVDGHAALHGSLWKGNRDVHVEVDEVLAASERALAMRIRWVGHGSRAGAFEIPVGQVVSIEQGRLVSVDQYDPGDREAMLARFAELSGGTAPVDHARAPERLLAEWGRQLARRDVEAIVALFAEDYETHDHRPAVSSGVGRGARTRADLEATLTISPDIRFTVEEVLACDDRVIAARVAYRGHATDGGGEFEVEIGWVVVVEDGLGRRGDTYEPEDRQAMIACYVELGGGLAPLGDSPPERACAEHSRRLARRDVDAIVAQFRGDYVMRDHRSTVFADVPIADVRASFEAMLSASETLRLETDEVLAHDDRVIARRLAHRGTAADGGGVWEVPAAWVSVVEDGLFVSTDVYEYDDDAAVLARFAELSVPADERGDRSPARWLEHYMTAFNRHDPDAFDPLLSDDFVLVDHRANGWGTFVGPTAMREHHVAGFRISPDNSLAIDSVLAGDDRVGAVCFTYRGHMADGGGEFEYSVGYVTLVEDGRALRTDVYEPEARQAMIARYVELGGGLSRLGDRESERILAEWCRRYARRDLEQMMELVAEEFTWVDHRPLSWETLDGDGIRALTLSAWEEAADIRIEIDEVLAVDERLIAIRLRFVGTGRRAGAFELPVGQVCAYQNGLCVSLDQYDYEDREAMLARFAELKEASPPEALGDRAPERWHAEYARRWAAADVNGLVEMAAEAWVLTDRRSVAVYGQLRGRQAAREMVASSLDGVRDPRFTVLEVLACDEMVMAAVIAWSGVGYKGAEFSNDMGLVSVVRDGLQESVELYEVDDRESMLARFAELSGRLRE